ncbi:MULTISPECIES: phospholipase D-like domain-containing protein [Actinosynnema]|uniref:phospholipase D-like domain-containing protein n=1 Tax=Actinosynnema TaxID=40566 RepID=UPI0020A349C8|nr:phospholipase D-like domain-containing protein [Actinosynnema pretiosum]MCP2094429.1 Phosphatidylserine/phosphatidylglycerophosphate/cardiolipin synthase [Actinosynnema pretiosum]
MKIVDVYVECVVLSARLQLVPRSGTSILETLVLKAIAAGVSTEPALTNLFGLTPRIMVDLLGDLWRAQRVVFAFDELSERITLTGRAERELAELAERELAEQAGRDPEAKTAAISSSMVVPATQKALLDPLTGRVLPLHLGNYAPGRANLVVPRAQSDYTAKNVDQEMLTAAFNQAIADREAKASKDFRVQSAYLASNELTTTNERYFITISVQVGLDGERLRVEVGDQTLSPEVRQVARDRLMDLVESAPKSAFVQALAAKADRVHKAPADVLQQLEEFSASARALTSTAPANRNKAHDQISAAAATLDAQVRDLVDRQMSLQVLRTSAEHQGAIDALIGAATRQLVVAVPWVTERGLLDNHVAALKQAVGRGVRVTLLWGIDRKQKPLDQVVLATLREIQRAARDTSGSLWFDPEQPSHLHAKLVLVDDRKALVTSKNFGSASNHEEIGLLVEADENVPSPVLESLLAWAHQSTPNYDHACSLIQERAVFGDRSRDQGHTPVKQPERSASLEAAGPGSPELLLWSRAWQDVGHRLADTVARLRPSVHLVRDHLHSSVLWDALGSASRRLLISSDQFSSTVVTTGFVRKLEECLDRGVNVALVYGRPHQEVDDAPVLTALAALASDDEGASSGRGRFTLVHNTGNHAKVLVFDDEVVAGSYNYLSFEARYGAGRKRQRSEVSLRVRSASVSTRVAELVLGTHYLAWEPEREQPAEKLRPAYLAAQSVLNALKKSGSDFDLREIASVCAPLNTGLSVVDALLDCGTTTSQLRRVHAALFAHAEPGSEEHLVWGTRLLDSLWTACEWKVAHLVRMALPEGGIPSSLLTMAASSFSGGPEYADVVRDAALAAIADDAGVEVVSALAVHAGVALLLHGDTALADPLEVLIELADESSAAFASTVMRHGKAYGALPVDALRDRASALADADSAERHWSAVSEAVAVFRTTAPDYEQGQLTKEHLFAPGGALSELQGVVDARDTRRLRDWNAANAENADRWLDKATRAAGSALITFPRRKAILAKSTAVLTSARDAEQAVAAGSDAWKAVLTAGHLTALDELAEHARRMSTASSEGQAQHLAVWALDRLTAAIKGDDSA